MDSSCCPNVKLRNSSCEYESTDPPPVSTKELDFRFFELFNVNKVCRRSLCHESRTEIQRVVSDSVSFQSLSRGIS